MLATSSGALLLPIRPRRPRDCPACVCPRDAHDGYGCRRCDCKMPIALITRKPGAS